MFDAQAAAFLDAHEFDPTEVADDTLSVTVVDPQGVTSVDRAATAARVTFSRKLHYLLANLTTDAARLVVRQNHDANGFETWRRLMKKFALPDATRHVSLLTQLLDFRFNPRTFEQDFNTWETIKVKYEWQTGTALPDSVLVATLLNKTSGALQTHLRLNARALTTYEQIRSTIIEYHQSRHILTGASSSSSQGPAPTDIGGLKGKQGFGKGGFSHFKGKEGKGKKGKLGKGKGNSAHMNFHSQAMAKGKGKDKGKSKLSGQHALVCWTCGKSGHVASQCPSFRVSALDENAPFEGEELGGQGWYEDDWSADTWSEDWWSDDFVAAVFGDGTWDDDWWWSTWDDGWSAGWTDTSWSVVQLPTVEKATSPATPAASEPNATSGAPVSAITLEPAPTSKAKAKATSKAAPKASGFATAALTLGSMFAGVSSCLVSPPCSDVSLDGMLDGCIAFNDFSVAGTCDDSSLRLPTWELSPVMYHLPHQDERGCESSLFHPKTLQDWGLGHLETSFFDPYFAEHESVVASVGHGNHETRILFDAGAAANCCFSDLATEFPLLQLDERAPPLKSIQGRL